MKKWPSGPGLKNSKPDKRDNTTLRIAFDKSFLC